jgi:hypothetical protein
MRSRSTSGPAGVSDSALRTNRLEEIRELFFGFRDNARPSERWKELSQRILLELEQSIDHAKAIQLVLRDQGQCGCVSLEEYGKRLLLTACSGVPRDVQLPNLPDHAHRGRRTASALVAHGNWHS